MDWTRQAMTWAWLRSVLPPVGIKSCTIGLAASPTLIRLISVPSLVVPAFLSQAVPYFRTGADPPPGCCAEASSGNVPTIGALRADCNDRKELLNMDKDRIEGAARQAKGAVKEAFGKVTGDAKTETEGKADKAAGKVQNAVGGAKDAARDALKK